MKRFLALLMACLMTASCAMAAEDYTVAEKLFKQLWAGSGFSGKLSVAFDTPALHTREPITADVDYIYVRPTEENDGEHRLEVTLPGGEAAAFQLKEDALSFQADVVSPDWYMLRPSEEKSGAAMDTLRQGAESALTRTGVPALSATALRFAAAFAGNGTLEEALEPYKLRADVWIEGYRQDAVLGKQADGSTTMEVSYVVSPAAIKAQVKQMLLDLLADNAMMIALTDALGEEEAQRYLNPSLQKWYFDAVDALPLTGDMTISRTVTLKGETQQLHLSLPLADAETGAVTVTYDRTKGEGDLPDENAIRVRSEMREMALTYQEYSSMTGVKVLQGTLADRACGDTAAEEKGEADLSIDFTLKQEETRTRDADGRDVYGYHLSVSLKPQEEEEIEAELMSRFMSQELKSAATEVESELAVKRGESSMTVRLTGSSRKKWTPEEIPAERVDVSTLTQADLAATLSGAGVRLMAALAGVVEVAPGADAQPESTSVPAEQP